jgi:pimeloyl-ACP methyl ester carboxylesterase
MTDYLLVHGAGQGAWVWGRVWGLMTAPEEHPPRLHRNRKANRVFPLDLPGHGLDAEGDTAAVRLEECVQSINRAVEREQLQDLVLVGHGFSGSLVLQAAAELPQPPKRIVLVAGIVPARQRSLISAYSQPARFGYHLFSFLSALCRQELRVPVPAINRYLCNTMGPMEVVQNLGFFGPLPTRVLKSRISLGDNGLPSPITYVVLSQDKVVSPDAQRQTAERFGSEEVVEIEACHQVMLEKPDELAEVLLRYA